MAELATFADRLSDAIRESGKRPAEVYRKLKVKKGTFYTWVGQRESVPEPATCMRLAEFLGINQRWLLTGKGPRRPMKKPYTQEQIDIAEAWPHLSAGAQQSIAVLVRAAVLEAVPELEKSLGETNEELQERANRLLEEAQARIRRTRA